METRLQTYRHQLAVFYCDDLLSLVLKYYTCISQILRVTCFVGNKGPFFRTKDFDNGWVLSTIVDYLLNINLEKPLQPMKQFNTSSRNTSFYDG